MKEIIMDEREWLLSALENNDLGKKPIFTISIYAKYLYGEGMNKHAIKKKIEEFLLRCDSSINLVSWDKDITYAIKKAGDRPLVKIDNIRVTEAEMGVISSAVGMHRQRLLFALLCLSKYHNAITGKEDYWTNIEIKDLFQIANVAVGTTRRGLLLNDLIRGGYITMGRRVNNTNIKVNYAQEESIPVVAIHDFRNLGYQYSNLLQGGYIECLECGLLIKKRSNRQMYCTTCAKKINLESTLKRYHNPAA